MSGVVALVIFGLFLLEAVVSSQNQAGPAPPPSATPDTSLPPTVLSYFYYWYELPDGPHSDELTDRPADPNTSYLDVGWFRNQLADMQDAGIDIALAVYWGPEEPSSDVGLENMARAAQELRDAGSTPPRIALFLDTGLIGRWPPAERDLLKEENQERVYDLIRTFYTILPRDQWAFIDDRPVVWLWAAWFGITFDQSTLDLVSSRFTADFGVEPYIVAEASWRHPVKHGFLGLGLKVDTATVIAVDDFYVWGAALDGFRDEGYGIAQVGPGYDERPLDGPGRSGRFAERKDGKFYRHNLELALASGRRLLAIETWNEFHEASDIAESAEYGRQYIEITREYADRFKAGGTLPSD
jgi:hypothetical protein